MGFLTFSIVGTVGALAAFWLLLYVDLTGGRLVAASIVYPEVVAAAAMGCGVVIGLATASGRSDVASLRRGVASAGVLLLVGLAAVGAFQLWTSSWDRGFDASEFRAATARRDYETIEAQARKAVNDRALSGMSPAQVRRELGQPPRVGRRRQLYVWHLGMINDFMGPGDDGALYVQFDPSWRRVLSARVDTSFD